VRNSGIIPKAGSKEIVNGKLTVLHTESPRNCGSILVRIRDFVFFEVQIGQRAHPASYPVGSEGLTTHCYLQLRLKMSTSSWTERKTESSLAFIILIFSDNYSVIILSFDAEY
jgi:hypothetical protein